MSYKEIKEFQLVKGTYTELVNRFKNSVVNNVEGYLGLEVGLNSQHGDYDLLILTFTWKDYDSFLGFKNSDLHAVSHKNKTPNPNVLKTTKKHFKVLD